jgi:hypothetical protein
MCLLFELFSFFSAFSYVFQDRWRLYLSISNLEAETFVLTVPVL